jgi:hypothetical protein
MHIHFCARSACCTLLQPGNRAKRLFWTLQRTHYFMTSPRTTRLSMLCLWRYLLLTYLTISVIRSVGHRA